MTINGIEETQDTTYKEMALKILLEHPEDFQELTDNTPNPFWNKRAIKALEVPCFILLFWTFCVLAVTLPGTPPGIGIIEDTILSSICTLIIYWSLNIGLLTFLPFKLKRK